MKVNSNIQGMIAQSILASNEAKMANSTQKMSSGYKLNYAKDNPAGMAISNRMNAQLRSLDRANKNANNAVNAIQTAEGAMAEIEEMLQRMNELTIKASNGTMTTADRQAVQEEVNQLTSEIKRVSKDTTYNSQGLLDGSQDLKAYTKGIGSIRSYNENFDTGEYKASITDGKVSLTKKGLDGNYNPVEILSQDTTDLNGGFSTLVRTSDGGEIIIDTEKSDSATEVEFEVKGIGGMKIQVGAEEGQEIQVVIPEVSLKSLNLIDLDGKRTVDCTTEEGAKKAIETVNKALSYVSAARAKVGAYQNRIENTISNLGISSENLTKSYSTIKDLDMAEGMVEYTTLQVLVQAGTTMLAQANEQPQQALQLLQ